HAQQAAGHGAAAGDALLQHIKVFENASALSEVGFALRGQAKASRRAIHEPYAQALLQCSQAFADRRGRYPQFLGRPGQAGMLGQQDEETQIRNSIHGDFDESIMSLEEIMSWSL